MVAKQLSTHKILEGVTLTIVSSSAGSMSRLLYKVANPTHIPQVRKGEQLSVLSSWLSDCSVATCSSSQLSSQQGTVDKSKTDNESIRQKIFIWTNISQKKVSSCDPPAGGEASFNEGLPLRRDSSLTPALPKRLREGWLRKAVLLFFDFILLI